MTFQLQRQLKKSDTDLILGRTGPSRIFPKFKISAQVRKFHTYVVGLTGRGKSKFLQSCIIQDILQGRGCAVIDPHGDLAKDVLRSLINNHFFDDPDNLKRIVYVAPRRRDYIIPFNVLKRPDKYTETYEIAQRVINAFMRTWSRTLQEPPRFQQVMRASLSALIETEKTICDLYSLLTDDDFREETLGQIPNPKVKQDCLAFFEHEFAEWGKNRSLMIGSTTNKVSALTDNPNTFYMLGQKENHLNIRKLMDAGKVLIADLGDCDDETKRLFGTLIVTGFEHAALSRSKLQHKDRTPYYLYIDEFQDFACNPGAAETFSQMLSQVRKFGLHLILANQSIAQLSSGLQTALGNAQTIVTFRISRADAEVISRMLGKVDPHQIKHDNQTDNQHPVYAPLQEQWESFIQQLTNQLVRQFTVKAADDRLASIWSLKMKEGNQSIDQLEEVIECLLKRQGTDYQILHKKLVIKDQQLASQPYYAY
jgi:hypothetical protein